MQYSVEDLKREIRVALDQNMGSAPLAELGDIDTLSLDEMIESKIGDAALMVERDAPHHLLDGGKTFATSSLSFDNNSPWDVGDFGFGRYTITLPDDYMRLVSFKMSDWHSAVTDTISEDDIRYMQLQSRYPGLSGTPQNPIVAVVRSMSGGSPRLMLEIYSSGDGEVDRAIYLPVPKITGGNIDLCERLKPAIVYQAAYMTAMGIGQENAAYFLQMSQTLSETEK